MFSSNTSQVSDGGYQISRSLRFNSADSAYLTRTPASAGNRKTWTWSGWVKRSALSSDHILFECFNGTNDNQTFNISWYSANSISIGAYNVFWLQTSALYRDVSAWYHIVVAVDTTQATANNRIRLYVNGSEVTAFSTRTNPSQNADLAINQAAAHYIGTRNATNLYFNGYLTEINFIDGQALTPSSFGQTNAQTGIWEPIRYSGTYGTNGFYLNFSDNSNTTAATLGKDSSGNGNNWTPTNFSVTTGSGNDSLVDTPTPYGVDTGVGGEVRGNYATLNTLDKGGGVTLTNGSLNYAVSSGAVDSVRATIGISSGKWYWEGQITGVDQEIFGIANASASTNTYVGGDANGWGFGTSGNKYNNNTATSYGSSCTSSDVIGVAFDADNGTLTFYKNGSSLGTAYSGLTTGVTYFPAVGSNNSAGVVNFGQRPFVYTAPSGYKALCTQNLPTPTIGATSTTQATDYFNTVLWTGNGSSSRAITGVGFAPDMVWYKSRSNAVSHRLFDKVRGANKELIPNLTDAEYTATDELLSFDSDGFTIGSETGTNANGYTYVGWSWRGNGAGSSNTAGSITSTVSANTTAGFSVVSWTCNNTANQSIGHGLGSVPKMIITKDRDQGTGFNWAVWFDGFSANEYLLLNTTGARASYSTLWYQTPDSTKFYIGSTGTGVNNATDRIIAYCFAPVAGFSAFSSYTGNGSTDGPFIYTGFRPAFLLIKASSGTSASGNGWQLSDDVREPYNDENRTILRPNSSDAEVTDAFPIDFLSNGFKIRNSGTGSNESGTTYIYAAFAENPFKYSLAR